MSARARLERAVDSADAALRDLLNLTLNVSRDGPSSEGPGAEAAPGASGQRGGSMTHGAASASAPPPSLSAGLHAASGAAGLAGTVAANGLAAGPQAGGDVAGIWPGRASGADDQQRRLVDQLLLNLKTVESFFAEREGEQGEAAVREEIALLEAEIATKDELLARVSQRLERWTGRTTPEQA